MPRTSAFMKRTAAIALVASLTACSVGHVRNNATLDAINSHEQAQAAFPVGATKADILTKHGEPLARTQFNQDENWMYRIQRDKIGPAFFIFGARSGGEFKQIVAVFGPDGLLKSIQYNAAKT